MLVITFYLENRQVRVVVDQASLPLTVLSLPRLSPLYLGAGDPVAPVRTAKAERRHQERLRMQSPELLSGQEKELSPAERRALEAEKRAMWRAAR